MPRNYIICIGIIALGTSANTQSLPRNPNMQEVIGYRIWEQKNWELNQLPSNSVQFRFQAIQPTWKPYFHSFYNPGYNFSIQSFRNMNLSNPTGISMFQVNPYPFIRVTRSGSTSRSVDWSSPENQIGSSILREIITSNRR